MQTQISDIAKLNDAFRKSQVSCFMVTKGVYENCDVAHAIELVRDFNIFNEANDPYGEHDFGVFETEDEKLFWKIDYYYPDDMGCCDPASPDCKRVLTLMLSTEY